MKEEWKQIIRRCISDDLLRVIPNDINEYCTSFSKLSFEQRKEFYVDLFTELCRFESNFDPNCTYKEGFNDVKGNPVISTGLFQLSVESVGGYGVKLKQSDLLIPEVNIKAMLLIATHWITKDRCIASDKSPWRGMSRYWSPFRNAAKKQLIKNKTLLKNYGGNMEETIYSKLYAMAKSQMGLHELPGKAHEKKILEFHAHTSLKAVDDETPWCSSFVCWVVDMCGLKSTNSAAARSWLKWGKQINTPVKGCIVVMKRPGGNHVTFFDHQDANYIYCLGGNQSNSVCISAYKKDRVLSYRGI